MIAGFYEPDAGDIFIGDRRINDVPAHRRKTAMVFQDYALFPHMSVEDNVGYGLKLAGMQARASPAPGRRDARLPRPERARTAPAEPAQRRSAAARGARAGAGHEPRGAAPGRAALQPGRPPAREHPRRADLDPAPARAHHDLRHPRPGRGAGHERLGRGHEPRQGRPVGHAVGGLLPAAHAVHGRFPGLGQPGPRRRPGTPSRFAHGPTRRPRARSAVWRARCMGARRCWRSDPRR